MGIISNCSVCPIVYNVVERVKDELWWEAAPDLLDGLL